MMNKVAVCILILVAAASSAWPPRLVSSASVTSFSYSSNATLLGSHPGADQASDGTLILGAHNSSYSEALYASPVSIFDATTRTLQSFVTFFTFSSNSSNGTLAFVIVPGETIDGLATARKTVSIEFNTECAGAYYNTSGYENQTWNFGRGPRGRGHHSGWYYGYGPGGPGHFGVMDYVNNSALTPEWPAWDFNGTRWIHNQTDGTGNQTGTCSLPNPNSYPDYLYQVVIQYNATSDNLLVGSPTCGPGPRVLNFSGDNNLPAGLFTADPYVGFVAEGGVYNISAWNFTAGLAVDVFTSLGVSTLTGQQVGLDGYGDIPGYSDGPGGPGRGGRGLSKAAKIGIAAAGAAVGAALILCLGLCLCRRRSRGPRPGILMKGVPAAATATASNARSRGLIPEHVVVFDAMKKPNKYTHEPVAERDTAPLTTNSSVTTSWVPPTIAPR